MPLPEYYLNTLEANRKEPYLLLSDYDMAGFDRAACWKTTGVPRTREEKPGQDLRVLGKYDVATLRSAMCYSALMMLSRDIIARS